MSKRFERTIEVHPGYDKRDTNDGIHGAELLFVLQGQQGCITFRCFTDWLPLAAQEHYMDGVRRSNVLGVQPVPKDMVIHSPKPLTYGQQVHRNDCPYTETGGCYSNTVSSVAPFLRDLLLQEGSEGVWRELQVRYRSAFSVMQLGGVKPKKRKIQG